MSKIQVETAQNVRIYQNIAGLGTRIGAYLIDMLVIVAYEVLMLYIFYGLSPNLGNQLSSVWVLLLVFGLPPFLYHLLMETFNNGQSIGKAILKIRVVRVDGLSPVFSQYLIRWLIRLVDFNLTSGAVAIFSYLLSGKGQRLGDIAAKTTVISEKQKIDFKQNLWTNLPADYQPVYPQVTIFSDQEIQEIKNLYFPAKKNKNYKVIESLALKIASLMEIEFAEPSMFFIERVIEDYNYYTQQQV